YAFMRHCDDISDTEGSIAQKEEEFAAWTQSFKEAISNGTYAHPGFPALHDAIRRFEIPERYFFELIDGTRMDLTVRTYDTFEDLRQERADDRFHKLMRFEVDRAQDYYRRGEPLLPLLHRDSRPAFWTMFQSYRTLLHRIERSGFNVFAGRVRIPMPQKLG